MERLGLIMPGQVNDNCANSDGSMRVLAEKCPTCPFRPKSSFNYQLKDIVKRIKSTPAPMLCHDTYPSDVEGALCRGGYDGYYKDTVKNPDFIEHPKSVYLVLPPYK